MVDHVLSFVTDANGEQVFIHMDRTGVDRLINVLERLRHHLDSNECDHDHLMTEDWGSDELSMGLIKGQEDELIQVHHVKLYAWNDEWKSKHGLQCDCSTVS